MSKVFYDKLIVLEEIEMEIKKVAKTKEEKEELWAIVDETIHHRVIGKVLEKLPKESHQEFLEMFHLSPHDENILTYLQEKIGENVEEIIKQEIGDLAYELLKEIRGTKVERIITGE